MILTSLGDVRAGMTLGVGLRNKEGHMLLGPGMALTAIYIERLRDLGYCAVWIEDEDTRDIPYQDTLSQATRLATTTAVQETFALSARAAKKLRAVSVAEVRDNIETVRFQHAFQDASMLERLTGHVDALVSEVLDRTVLTGLGSIWMHDNFMYQHCVDVTVTATMLGRLIGYDTQTLKKLAIGALLHDIGYIFVDTLITNKPGRLTDDEFKRVKDHTTLGYLFLRDSLRLGVLSAHLAYQHHERQDGAGYPRGLTGTNRIVQGTELHLPGRITPMGEVVAIADFHDACSSERPYRRRMTPDAVWRTMQAAAGAQLNREMVEKFLAVLPPFPLATPVKAMSGRWAGYTGVVARIDSTCMATPVVRFLHDATGKRISAFEVDLKKTPVKLRGVLGLTASS
jgi:HD-GYP domain-containing protein (c-di-GMP phosphodiesterase class II)